MTDDAERVFTCLFLMDVSSLVKCPVTYFAHLPIGLLTCSWLLGFEGSLDTVDPRSLQERWFAGASSWSEARLSFPYCCGPAHPFSFSEPCFLVSALRAVCLALGLKFFLPIFFPKNVMVLHFD